MPITPPSLDDRRFDDLVEDLIARIPAHTPEWTNPRQGDPGRTLLELFAWLGDALLYRVNLVPERQRLVFLRLLGMPLRGALPAGAVVQLAPAQPSEREVQVLRPAATIAGPVPFETMTETTVLPVSAEVYIKRALEPAERARLGEVVAALARIHRVAGAAQPYETRRLFADSRADPDGVDVFAASADRALWVALLAPPASAPETQAQVNDSVRGALGGRDAAAPPLVSIGVVPKLALPELFENIEPPAPVPVLWEVLTHGRNAFEPDYLTLAPLPATDTTAGLTRAGTLNLPLPDESFYAVPSNDVLLNPAAGVGDTPPRIDDAERAGRIVAWLRLRPRPDAQVASLPLSWLGINAVAIDQRITLSGRVLGHSNGTADQSVALPQGSVDAEALHIEVEEPGRGYQPWTRVDDLTTLSADANVAREAAAYELDAGAGTLRFGDGVRGRIPERQMRIRLARGRFGGGRAGNLPPLTLSDISALRIDGNRASALKVTQPLPTLGGEDAETLAQAEKRIPAMLRHRDRAVTALDYQRLALEAPGVDVGRVEVLAKFKPKDRRFDVPGVVSVMVLPARALSPAPDPRPDRPFLERVHAHLAARSPLATELYVIGCEYVPLGLAVAVAIRDGYGRDAVLFDVREALRRLLWPLAPGGADGNGWALGRAVRERELEVEVSRVPGVREVAGINLFEKAGDAAAGAGPAWRLLPRAGGEGSQSLGLAGWQLPELLAVVVVDAASGLPTSLAALPNPFAQADAVAVPVVPELC
jgi:predicted phage baseplate assembly protein